MPKPQRTFRDAVDLFRSEHDRINADVYAGKLPPFPGVESIRALTKWAEARWSAIKNRDVIALPYRLDVTFAVYAPLHVFVEIVRHEIAHIAVRWHGLHNGEHDAMWKYHAIKCGAAPRAKYPDASFLPLRR